MDIGHDTMGVIIINSYSLGAVVSAVSDIYSKDDNGTGATGDGNSKFTKTVGGSAQHNQVILNPMEVQAGQAITVGLNGNWTGTETSIAWSVIVVDNGLGLVSGVSPTSGTSAGFDPIFTIGAGASQGMAARYTLRLAVTNSGGTTTKDWDFTILIP
tara:strand:- start:6184 stop:6654 length:471 start_codon:yes stop_codon:yes gene_type:complete